MKKRLVVVAALLGALILPASAGAAPPDGLGPWADYVVSAQQGTARDGSPVLPSRSDPTAAVGVAENVATEGTFYSLGFGGQITLGYQNNICNGSGADLDLELVEATIEPNLPELVDVYVSLDGVTYTKVASGVNKDANVAFPVNAPPVARFVRLVDVTPRVQPGGKPQHDAYDVDGVRALNTNCVTGTFSCTASALRVNQFGFEPVIANKPDVPCVNDEAQIIDLAATTSGAAESASDAQVIYARTTASPGGSPGGLAEAGATNASVGVSGLPTPVTVQVLSSQASVSCNGTTPVLNGSSHVENLQVAGNPPITTSAPMTISLGALGSIKINHTTLANGKLTQRALWVDLTGEQFDVVVGRSAANYEGNPCL